MTLGSEVIDSCEQSYESWELNLDSMEDHSVLLYTEPSLQTPKLYFIVWNSTMVGETRYEFEKQIIYSPNYISDVWFTMVTLNKNYKGFLDASNLENFLHKIV